MYIRFGEPDMFNFVLNARARRAQNFNKCRRESDYIEIPINFVGHFGRIARATSKNMLPTFFYKVCSCIIT